MTQHIIGYIEDRPFGSTLGRENFREILTELELLHAMDFLPVARAGFMRIRSRVRQLSEYPSQMSVDPQIQDLFADITHVLGQYAGEGSRAVTRDFAFVVNLGIREIVERDYRELVLKTFPDGSWKSSVILAGSILEAVLFDQLTNDPARILSAMSAASAPKKKGGTRDITLDTYEDEWNLNSMIKVACELGILPANHENAVHVVLREYRNFVHPRAELHAVKVITEGYATASKGMLDVVLDHLTP